MPLPQEVLDLLKTPIDIERFMGKDQWGNPVYSPAERVMSAVQVMTRRRGSPTLTINSIGTPVEVMSRLIVDYGNFSPFDRVTLTSGQKPTVISVDTQHDENGNPYFQEFIVEENRK